MTEYGDEVNPQTEQKIKALADNYANINDAKEWERVYAAFGGLAIYRFEAVKGLRYQLLDNDDERVEVKCEHYSIYKQMAERGYDKVYINPQMKLKYQSLSMKIIINHILRLWDRRVDRQTKKIPPHTSRQHKIVFMPYCYGGNHELKAA